MKPNELIDQIGDLVVKAMTDGEMTTVEWLNVNRQLAQKFVDGIQASANNLFIYGNRYESWDAPQVSLEERQRKLNERPKRKSA